MNILICNTKIFTNDPQQGILNDQALAIQGSKIHELGNEADLKIKYQDYARIDGKGRLLMPGMVNAHMHFYSTFARGIALSGSPQNFSEILSMLWWKLDRALDPDSIYYSALLSSITAIKQGVTSIIDHHASPNAVDGSLDRIEEALQQLGMRGVLCYEISDRDGNEVAQQGLRENERYIKKCQQAKTQDPNHLLDAMIGLHASFTLHNDTLEKAGAISQSLQKGCHIHLGEDPQDRMITQEKYDAGLVDRLQQFGILGTSSITAHGIHLTDQEKDGLAQTDTMLVHNPQSNMNNAVGRTDIFSYLKRGVLLGMGTDGMSPDLKPDIRTALLLQKHDLKDNTLAWNETRQMVLSNNPAIMKRVSGQNVGKIAPGFQADLILVDYYPPTPLTSENFWGHFLFGICDAVVDTGIINGKVVMQNKHLPGIDEEKIAIESHKCAQRVWDRFNN
ncbi:MAG: putative aminohydrolase SsnA [SAR324 cluster bacterium]|nr:putative aminohydrolase SsnA [SAR324 cluster bacterium]